MTTKTKFGRVFDRMKRMVSFQYGIWNIFDVIIIAAIVGSAMGAICYIATQGS